MDTKELGEIAFEILSLKIREEGLQQITKDNITRTFGNLSKKTGIPAAKLKKFYLIVLMDAIEEAFV